MQSSPRAGFPFLTKRDFAPSPLGRCQLCNCNQVGGFAAILELHRGRGGLAPSGRQGTLTLKALTASPRSGLSMGLRGNPALKIGEFHMNIREPFDWTRLHPKARPHFAGLADWMVDQHKAGLTPTLFKPFEGYRSPERQEYLFSVEKTTKARAFQSAHNYGLAVDFVPFVDGKWSWDENHDWGHLDYGARQRGLFRPIKWDRPHVEHPIWYAIKSHLI